MGGREALPASFHGQRGSSDAGGREGTLEEDGPLRGPAAVYEPQTRLEDDKFGYRGLGI
jgi:hypothetical protein